MECSEICSQADHNVQEVSTHLSYHEKAPLVAHPTEYKVLLLTYKAQNNMAPVYLSDLLQCRVDWGSRRDNTLLLVDPKINRVTFEGRAFFKAAPVLWNNIPPSLRASVSVAQFKKNLKTHLCHKIYDCSCWRILIFNITNDLLVLQTNCFICRIYELILICFYVIYELILTFCTAP